MSVCSRTFYSVLMSDLTHVLGQSVCDRLERGENVDRWPDMSSEQFAALALGKSVLKKFTDETSPDAAQLAVEKFLACNRLCMDFSLSAKWEKDVEIIGEVRQFLYAFTQTYLADHLDLTSCFANGRVGPGASVLARGGDLYSKMFSSKLSCSTDSLARHFKSVISFNHRWFVSDAKRQANVGDYEVVSGSLLSTVPKSRDIDRTICTEPSLNMFYQLGLGCILERGLFYGLGISLDRQPDRNRVLAKLGSEHGKFATIDLSSASDTISMTMIRQVLPRQLLGLVELLRTPRTVLPNGGIVTLQMVSTMGNGFTFPLQTLLFAAIVGAVYKFYGRPLRRPRLDFNGNFGVFGDDIIVESDLYDAVVSALELFGFTVNRQKSFAEGPFRESCGHDYFNGRNVRGVYIKTFATEQSRYSALNRLTRWSKEQNIALRHTLRFMKKSVRPLFVPLWEADDAGICVPLSELPKRRYNRNGSLTYKKWVASPSCIRVLDDKVVVPRGKKRLSFNEDGLYLTFLAGYLREYSIFVRNDNVKYKKRSGVAPNWDLSSPSLELFLKRARFENGCWRWRHST